MKHLFFVLITLATVATLVGTEAEPSTKPINRDIEKLTQEIKQNRLKALNAQIEAQALLQTEWEEYSQKIKEADYYTETAQALEQRMHILQAQQKSAHTDSSKSKAKD